MRILYLSGETPIIPAGGIATYLEYMAPAMQAAGHEIFLFTWTSEPEPTPSLEHSPFPPQNTWMVRIPRQALSARFPDAPPNHALAQYLLPTLLRCIEAWNIDVIEATDYQSPAIALFQHLQSSHQIHTRLCVTYNHGFIEDFIEADQIAVDTTKLIDLSGERQQCRASDLIVAPSQAAQRRLISYGVPAELAQVVREPYLFTADTPLQEVRPVLAYLGRISLSKGIDTTIYFANAIEPIFPLDEIRLIGREIPTPFRVADVREYVRYRLSPGLREKLLFQGYMPRSQARTMLSPGEIAPHFGYAETFSYAFIESIDQGLLPVTRANTPMAEFFPRELHEHILPEKLGTPAEIQHGFLRLHEAAAGVTEELKSHNRTELDPTRIANQMGDLYAQAYKRKRGRISVAGTQGRTAGIEDVTILMPVYRPDPGFAEAIDSIATQTTGTPRVLICDDGTPEGEGDWFDYAAMRLSRCQIIRQANGGLLATRNTLIQHLDTPLALFLDADDLLMPTCLERMLEAYNESPRAPHAVLVQRWNFGEGSERVLANMLEDHLHLVRNDFRMTALIESESLRSIGFDPLRRNGEADDWVFWLRFFAHGYRGVMVPEPLFRYRFRKGSMSWPWSVGQAVGTNAMLKQAVAELIARRPETSQLVAKAFSMVRPVGEP